MLFGRREPTALSERIRVFMWPRRSWARSSKYIFHRLHRLRSSPHAIALGCAIGVFVSFTPFLGFQLMLAGLLAWLSRASIIASMLGTFIGNPLTFPFIWMGAYQLGTFVLAKEAIHQSIDLSVGILHFSAEQLWLLVLPMTIGGLSLGVVAAALCYFPLRRAVEIYQRRRDVRTARESIGI